MNKLTQLLGIKFPLIQAPMAGVQGSALAIAVSNAGGLGSLPCAMLSTDELIQELKTIRAQTDKPFNVNFFCHTPPEADPIKDKAWQAVLSPYYKEYKIDPAVSSAPAAKRLPFNMEAIEILEQYKPNVVSFHFGLPAAELLARVRKWGARIIASATTVEEALWLEEKGVDAVIAQGLEAGGHRGHFLSHDLTRQVGTFALLPQIVQAIRCPVIAAGGIADNEGVLAALNLGASAVQVGTAYLLCPEVNTKALHRAAIKSTQAKHTAITNVLTGRPARSIVNRVIQELGPINATVPPFPLAATAIAALRSAAEQQGHNDFSSLWCGQNASGCKEIPAAELTRLLCEGGP